jgi:cell division septal protein FtsQ
MAKVAVHHDRVTSNLSAARLRSKKRTRDISKSVVGGLFLLLGGQVVAALYMSPIFAVSASTVSVKASPLCTESQIRSLIQPDLPQSVVRLPLARWSDALGNLPVVKSATITTGFPNRVNIVVKDRQPQVVSELGVIGRCTLDADLIPFRLAGEADQKLPNLVLQSDVTNPEFGVSVADKAQVAGIQTILKWLGEHPDVAASSLTIQNKNLSFVVQPSNVNVLLGTPRRLREKLDSLEVLIEKRPDLLTSHKYSAVNLFSDEYPALVSRSNPVDKSAVP